MIAITRRIKVGDPFSHSQTRHAFIMATQHKIFIANDHDNVFKISETVAYCTTLLREQNIDVEFVEDHTIAPALVREATETDDPKSKPYVTAITDPIRHVFTSDNCFWIFLRHDGRIVGTGCAILHRLRSESFHQFYDQMLRNLYPDEAHLTIPRDRLPHIADEMTGNIVYLGDLYIHSAHQGQRSINASRMALLLKASALLKWPELDYVYCFLRARDGRFGAGTRYGFPTVWPGCLSYSSPISTEPGENHFAIVSRRDLTPVVLKKLGLPFEPAEVHDPSVTTVLNLKQ